MSLHKVLILVALALLVSTSASSQLDRSIDGQPETPEQGLQRHHIALTKDSLVRALRSHDKEVRQLAAYKLSADGARDTLPSLIKALRAETAPVVQLDIAYSIAALGGEEGLAKLKSTCEDSAAPGSIRMLAAQLAENLNKDSCRDAVISVLRAGNDPDARVMALEFVPNWQHVSEEESRMLFDLVVKALEDQESRVRFTASSILGRLGNVSAIPFLQTALAIEQNESCRLQMGMDLQRLRKQEEHPPGSPDPSK